jgi:DNA-binding SARP family transcriptional activator
MIFGVLGPLLVDDGVEQRTVSAAKQRIILAALLLAANRIIVAGDLVDLVWDEPPPRSHRAALHNYLTRLRRSMGAAGPRLETRSPGYLLRLEDDSESDLRMFERHARAAQAAVDAALWERAGAAARDALDLWRGTPLIDVPCDSLHHAWLPTLRERRLQLIEWRIESDLRRGLVCDVVTELQQLTAAYPMRERFHGQLMVALSSTGRQGEALTVYQRARQQLVDELGIEPGPELRRVHQLVLAGELDTTSVGAR